MIWSQIVSDSPRKSEIDQDGLIWSEVVADGEQIVRDGPMFRDGFKWGLKWDGPRCADMVIDGQTWSDIV